MYQIKTILNLAQTLITIMKKTLKLLTVVIALGFISTSCMKEWECSCDYVYDDENSEPKNMNQTDILEAQNKKNAQDACESKAFGLSAGSSIKNVSCDLNKK